MPQSNNNHLIRVEIIDISRGGAGVGRAQDGRVVFVPATLVGDEVEVQIVSQKPRYLQARLIRVLTPSADRVEPPCPVFGRCGGCEWQHVPYWKQWETKLRGNRELFQRFDLPQPQSGSVEAYPAERVWEYRNRVQLHWDGENLGFFRRKTHQVIPVERCEIARPEINEALAQLRNSEKLSETPRRFELQLDENQQVIVKDASENAVAFRQVHDEQNQKLRSWVLESLPSAEECWDLYGGSGNFGVPLAKQRPETKVQSVDRVIPESARQKAPANLEFHQAGVSPWLDRQRKRKKVIRSAILDPPRKGLGKDANRIIASLEACQVQRLILIGCDPDAWGRDLKLLVNRGWCFKRAGLFDLFPQTHHVESVALFSLHA